MNQVVRFKTTRSLDWKQEKEMNERKQQDRKRRDNRKMNRESKHMSEGVEE